MNAGSRSKHVVLNILRTNFAVSFNILRTTISFQTYVEVGLSFLEAIQYAGFALRAFSMPVAPVLSFLSLRCGAISSLERWESSVGPLFVNYEDFLD